MYVVYASKDYHDTELYRNECEKNAKEFAESVRFCEGLSGYDVIIREE